MSEPVRVGVVGMGTVGSGVVRLLVESADHIERHAGRRIVVEKAVVKDVAKARSVQLPGGKISSDIRDISRDPSISVTALLVGGLEPAQQGVAFDVGLKNGVDDADGGRRMLLIDRADTGGLGQADLVAGGVKLAQDQLEQGRLADAVAADQADL